MAGTRIDLSSQGSLLRTMAQVDFGRLAELRDAVERGLPARLRLDLFGDISPVAQLHRVTRTERGYAISGRIDGQPNSAVTLVAHGDVFYGTVWTHDDVYEIRTDGAAEVVERLPSPDRVCRALASNGVDRNTQAGGIEATGDDAEADVLVFYTASARRRVGGHRNMLARIDHHVAWTNAAFELSATKMRISLVGVQELAGFSEADGRPDELLDLFRDGLHVQQLRDALAADLVLLHTTGTQGGLAFVPIGDDDAFSISSMRVSTFAHELGHNMGLWHTRVSHRSNEPFPYSHGHVFHLPRPEGEGTEEHCTIMCGGGSNLPRFSNARQMYRGALLGVPGDEPSDSIDGPADAARSLDEWMGVVTGFRHRASRCDYRFVAETESIPAEGGKFDLRVETSTHCTWQPESVDGFSEVLSASRGVGNGVIAYAVPANEGWAREIAIAVAGHMHIVLQPGGRRARSVCERSADVRRALEAKTAKRCDEMGIDDLLRVGQLKLDHDSGPVRGDFDGLANLGALDLSLGDNAALAPGVFEGLVNLQRLDLRVQGPFEIVPGVFEGLAKVRELEWNGTHQLRGALPSLPPGAFRGLSGVHTMVLWDWNVGDIESGAFEGMGQLVTLIVNGASLRSLSAGAFRGLHNVRSIHLFNPRVPMVVAAGAFEGATALEDLSFAGMDSIELKPGVFRPLSKLESLTVQNTTPILTPGVFDGLSTLRRLAIRYGGLRELPPGLFSGLSSLLALDMSHHQLRELPPSLFAGLSNLQRLDLSENELTRLPTGAFDDPNLVSALILSNNQLEALPPDILGGPNSYGQSVYLGGLWLDGNRLDALPRGFFTGRNIWKVSLLDNPGAPFGLVLQPKRTSQAWRRPVTAAVYVAEGTPLDLDFELSASGLEWRSRPATLPAGKQWSEPFDLRPVGRTLVSVGVGGLPDIGDASDCDIFARGRCYLGLRLVAGAPLTLNGVPDRKMEAEGTPWRIDLADVFLEFDSPPRSYQLASSDPLAATATVADDILTVTAHDAGTSTITVTATMADGRSGVRAFTVTVTEDAHRFLRGWRLGLLEKERR